MPSLSSIPTVLGQLAVGIGIFTTLLVFVAKTWPQRRAVLILLPSAYSVLFAVFVSGMVIGQVLTLTLMHGPAEVLGGLHFADSLRGRHGYITVSNGDRYEGAAKNLIEIGICLCVMGWGVFVYATGRAASRWAPWLTRWPSRFFMQQMDALKTLGERPAETSAGQRRASSEASSRPRATE